MQLWVWLDSVFVFILSSIFFFFNRQMNGMTLLDSLALLER